MLSVESLIFPTYLNFVNRKNMWVSCNYTIYFDAHCLSYLLCFTLHIYLIALNIWFSLFQLLPVHRYSGDISFRKESRIPLKPMLGGMRSVALFISSHEQTH